MTQKLEFTQTYLYRDTSTPERPIAMFTPVVLESTLGPNGESIVRPLDPSADFANLSASGNLWTVNKPLVGVTQGWCLHNRQVAVMYAGLTRVIATAPVKVGDIVFVGAVTNNAADRVLSLPMSNSLFQRTPELRPLIHPLFGREFSFVVHGVFGIAPDDLTGLAAAPRVFFPLGVAVKPALTASLTNPQIITVQLSLHPVIARLA